MEGLRIEKDNEASTTVIGIDYLLTDSRYRQDVNFSVFEKDCLTPVPSSVLPIQYSSQRKVVSLNVTFNITRVENTTIWNFAYNKENLEVGGNSTFCVRAGVVDKSSGYEMDFTESIVYVIVDKVGKADFSLTVQVDRVDADEDEIITGIGSVRGFQCDVNTFVQNNTAVSQGRLVAVYNHFISLI